MNGEALVVIIINSAKPAKAIVSLQCHDYNEPLQWSFYKVIPVVCSSDVRVNIPAGWRGEQLLDI